MSDGCSCPCINCSNKAHWMCSTCYVSREEMVDLGDGISVCAVEPLSDEEKAALHMYLQGLRKDDRGGC